MTAAPEDGRRYPARPSLAASLACFRDDGAVLIARRGKPPAERLWSLPGGMVELGETVAAAAVRELFEETGVVARVIGVVDVVDVIQRGVQGSIERHVAIIAFAGRLVSGTAATGPEATEVAWVRPEQVTDYDTTPGLAAVIAKAAALTLCQA